MPEYVIDTGVILSADGKNDDTSIDGQVRCIRRLREVQDGGGLVLDDGGRIIGEYLHKTAPWNPQTTGEQFLLWALSSQGTPTICRTVAITPKVDDEQDFEEFPKDDRLSTFERADRKFVATACAGDGQPPVVVAIDTDYYMPNHRAAFNDHGVTIDYICEDDLKRVYERKYGGG